LSCRRLSAYAFENIFIWKTLFSIRWTVARGNLCCFFEDQTGCFMYLPPLGPADKETALDCFRFMEEKNANRDISRMENVEEGDLGNFSGDLFRHYKKGDEYLLSQKDAATLRGDRYRHKRNLCNYFEKNFPQALLRPYAAGDRKAVLALHQAWRREREARRADPVYRAMLQDSARVLEAMLASYEKLEGRAFVVEVSGRLAAFSSGFPLPAEGPFCVNFEFADLALKGVCAWIFREFSRCLTPHSEINIMDDSGLENLRQAKFLYHPSQTVASHTVLLADGARL